jgi:hypothetical protein
MNLFSKIIKDIVQEYADDIGKDFNWKDLYRVPNIKINSELLLREIQNRKINKEESDEKEQLLYAWFK